MNGIVHCVDEQQDLCRSLDPKPASLAQLSSSQASSLYYPVLEEVQMNFNIHLMFTRKMNSASAGAKETRYSRAMSKV